MKKVDQDMKDQFDQELIKQLKGLPHNATDKVLHPEKYREVIIKRALFFATTARREGLLVLESYLDEDLILQRDVFEYGMKFVVDGTDATFIARILNNLIHQCKNPELRVSMIMQKEAVMMIQRGDNPKMINYMLNSYTNCPLKKEDL